jgi:hypothetical protein
VQKGTDPELLVIQVGRTNRVRGITLSHEEALQLMWMLSQVTGIPYVPQKKKSRLIDPLRSAAQRA